MAHRTEYPNADGVRATNLKVDILVYVAWCDLRGRYLFRGTGMIVWKGNCGD
jgi:hypothetical protein